MSFITRILIMLSVSAVLSAHAAGTPVLLANSVYNNLMDVIDLRTQKSLAFITVGIVPHKMVILPSTPTLVYVANRGTQASPGYSLSLIDLRTLKNIKTINIGKNCEPHGITGYQNKIYIACFNSDEVKRYDPVTEKVDWQMATGSGPHEIFIFPENNKIYTTNQKGDSISIIDMTTQQRKDISIPPGAGPTPMALSPDKKNLWVGARDGNIYVLDLQNEKIIASFKAGDSLFDLRFTPDGKYAIAASLKPKIDKTAGTFDFSNGMLIAIDPINNAIKKFILLNNSMPVNIDFSNDGEKIFVSLPHTNNANGIELYNPDVDKIAKLNNEIGVVDLATLEYTGSIKTATSPAHLYVTNLPNPAESPQMNLVQSIPTNNARGWDFFTLDGKQFLAAAEFTIGYPAGEKNINSTLYQWNGKQFIPFQLLPTQGARYVQHVKIAKDFFLMMINSQSTLNGQNTYDVKSVLYRWNGKKFEPYQSIATNKIVNLHFFNIAGDTYLALAANADEATQSTTSQSPIYKWDGKQFVLFQTISTGSANAWTSFSLNDKTYLAVANSYGTSEIFQWDGKQFVPYQSLNTNDARGITPFTLSGETYLAIANLAGASVIYQWQNNKFIPWQVIKTPAARYLEFIQHKKNNYLIASNFAHTNITSTPFDLTLYQLAKDAFQPQQTLSMNGGTQQTIFFEIGDKKFLLVSVVFGPSLLYELTF